ncbi:type 11 methyltransferase [Caballeronia udeis]|uniref:Type 11 methyltransferase n=1 Tax=Caballeronia udeis TaxID=1232866 RepID=A0A158EY26_9BURK|nr:methyltransferase domain-containing protein [Caballeronia udeis]SAL12403.1 type 11 methyltransferase [Caballeronia udeis]
MTSAVLNSLIARVKADSAAHEPRKNYDEAPPAPVAHHLLLATTPMLSSASAHPGTADIGLFLEDHGDEFVKTSYRFLLGREPDAKGVAIYVGQISRGATRLGIAAKIRLSKEGRRVGVRVRGLGLPMMLIAADSVLRRSGLGVLTSIALRRLEARAVRRAAPFVRHRAVERMLAAWHPPLERIAGMVPRHEHELAVLSQHLSDLQEIVTPVPPVPPEVIDSYYLAFEDANRGSQESVMAKLAVYDNWFASLMKARVQSLYAVVDIGCGRGEWLSYVTRKGFDAVGVDMNSVMVNVCLQRGFDAQCTDALSFLRSLPTGSVTAVTGFHVIEHVPFDYLFALVAESYRVLAEGGAVLFETPNPENVLVGSHTFYHDFTHRHPITPTAISFLLKHQGFKDIDIIRSSPYPDEAKVPGNDPLTERVNGHLCGPQDFAVTGFKNRTEESRT